MPLHDRSRMPSGLIHHFHQDWSIEIAPWARHAEHRPSFADSCAQGCQLIEPIDWLLRGPGDAAED
jgi:hypothetical protein